MSDTNNSMRTSRSPQSRGSDYDALLRRNIRRHVARDWMPRLPIRGRIPGQRSSDAFLLWSGEGAPRPAISLVDFDVRHSLTTA